MSLYIPTWEEIQKAKELRSDIFEMVMKIRKPKKLENLKALIRGFSSDDYKEEPLQLDEFVAYLDLPMVVLLRDLFKNENPNLIVKQQIDELCERNIATYQLEVAES